MDVENRYVTFGHKINGLKTQSYDNALAQRLGEKKHGYLAVKEGIRWALDAAGNTGQYIRYVNMKIDKHQEQINHIKRLQQRFDREVADLQSEKIQKMSLQGNNLDKVDSKTVTSILDQLLLAKRNTKFKLKKLENECALAEKELERQEIQIEDARGFVRENQRNGINSIDQNNEIKALKIIREELHYLGKNNNINKLSNAIDILVSSTETNFQKSTYLH